MNLTFLKNKYFWITLSLSAIGLIAFIGILVLANSTRIMAKEIKRIETPEQVTENVIVECDNENIEVLTTKSLYRFIKEIGIQHPEIVLAQAILETGNLSNKEMINNNNLFGMTVPSNRPCMKIGTYGQNYCQFGSWYDSVIDYAFYQSRYCWGMSETQYYNHLKKNYATDPQYVTKVKDIVKHINKYIK